MPPRKGPPWCPSIRRCLWSSPTWTAGMVPKSSTTSQTRMRYASFPCVACFSSGSWSLDHPHPTSFPSLHTLSHAHLSSQFFLASSISLSLSSCFFPYISFFSFFLSCSISSFGHHTLYSYSHSLSSSFSCFPPSSLSIPLLPTSEPHSSVPHLLLFSYHTSPPSSLSFSCFSPSPSLVLP